MKDRRRTDRGRIEDLEKRVRRTIGTISTTITGSGPGVDTTAFHQGGDSFGATATIGTNDAQDVAIERGGTTVADLDASRLHLATGYRLQLGTLATHYPGAEVDEYAIVTDSVAGGLRLSLKNTSTATNAATTIGCVSNTDLNDLVIGIINPTWTAGTIHVAGEGFLVMANGAGGSTNTGRGMLIGNRLGGYLRFAANDTEWIRLLTTGLTGFQTTTPRRRVDILDASNPQLRLTHTDNTDYAEWQVDTDGILTLTSSGLYTQIHKSGGGTVGGLTEGQFHFRVVTNTDDLTNAITWASHSSTGAANHQRAQAGIYVQGSNSYGTKMFFGTSNNFTNGAITRLQIDNNGGMFTTPAATGHAVFNEDGVDADLRVEGDTNTSLLHVDASADTVQVNSATTADSAKFYVDGKISTSGELEVNGALNHDGTTVGLYAATPAAQGTGGQNVTNNVTDDGSTAGTIPDITDGLVYANDYVNLRRALHQIARMLKQDHDQLRAMGILT